MIPINLDGYYSDSKNLPNETGIYVVYACHVQLGAICNSRIIYIGAAKDLQGRHYKDGEYIHERLSDFKNECSNDETLFYCYAIIDLYDLKKVENALIFMQQPKLNTQGKDGYHYEADYFKICGSSSDSFNLNEFGFRQDYDGNSLYTDGEIF